MRILQDAALRPEIFVWYGPVRRQQLAAWQDRRGLRLPEELVELWCRTGGGDVFETEEILAPMSKLDWATSFDSTNAHHRSLGMSSDFALFHVGLCLSAVRLFDGIYAVLGEQDYRVLREYEKFDNWYNGELRSEYGSKYGLPLLPV